MSESDQVWLERLKDGDRDTVAEFINEHHPQLSAVINKNLSDQLKRKVEANDILQEVTISALSSYEEIDFEQKAPFSWLCQLAERRIIDAHRKYIGAQKRSAQKEVGLNAPAGGGADGEQKGLIDLLVLSMTSPSQAFSRGQKEFALLEALDTLPDESKQALQMRYVEGLPSKEIAEHLGKTDGATRVLLTRSLGKLQSILSQNNLFQSFQTPPE